MSEVKELASSILRFLIEQQESGTLNLESKESLEISIQCLEIAYEIDRNDLCDANSIPSLMAIYSEFRNNVQCMNESPRKEEEEEARRQIKSEADAFKDRGNYLMRSGRYAEARTLYSKAIELDCSNAVYFCNRAAAHSKLGDFASTITDCKKAIGIDPNYGKAYSRMGYAHLHLNQIDEANTCYRKACELEPDNVAYENNLRLANRTEHLSQQTRASANPLRSGQPINLLDILNRDYFPVVPQIMPHGISNLLRNVTMQDIADHSRSTLSSFHAHPIVHTDTHANDATLMNAPAFQTDVQDEPDNCSNPMDTKDIQNAKEN